MIKLSWKEVDKMADDLAEKVGKSGFQPDYLIGITTGGLIPLGFLAKRLKIGNILIVSARSYGADRAQKELKVTRLPDVDLKGKKILLVDEIADTGTTLKKISEIFLDQYEAGELKTATLAANETKSAIIPDFYAMAGTGEWIRFPWESDKD